jgi:hypothetical protein
VLIVANEEKAQKIRLDGGCDFFERPEKSMSA